MITPGPTSEPPFMDRYRELLCGSRANGGGTRGPMHGGDGGSHRRPGVERDPPVIDLEGLTRGGEEERQACVGAIARASSEWGFFQVVNHGISPKLLGEMRRVQVRVFERPFEEKASCGLLASSYSWGTPTATSAHQLSWSEACHIPLAKISGELEEHCNGELSYIREVMERFAGAVSELAGELAGILAESLSEPAGSPAEICSKHTCFLRLNRYPPCPLSMDVHGMVPHTDSDFLTVLCQDQVGGLQVRKESEWVDVRPNPDALIVNIGDLFQAWSSNVYKSVEHRVVAGRETQRYSVAYFLCPADSTVIGSFREPSPYRRFTFGEYRRQVQEDVKNTGRKVGLPRFLLP